MKIAFQIEPLSQLKPLDSGLALIREALIRGHSVWVYQGKDLSFDQGQVRARALSVPLNGQTDPSPTVLDLSEMDVVWIRSNPPFDMAYLTPTYVLEALPPRVRVINPPASLRNYPEKLWPMRAFSQWMAPTLLTRHSQDVLSFWETHGTIVLKPLFGYGGHGVLCLSPSEKRNWPAFEEMLFGASKDAVIAQAYLPEIAQGDTRVFFVDGRVRGALSRVPAPGQFLSGSAYGSDIRTTELTQKQRDCCVALEAGLQDAGFFLAGVDFIGDYLTEINLTSPTLLPQFNQLYGVSLESEIWDLLEKRSSKEGQKGTS